MKKKIDNNISGYIEGYYGKLLTWESRKLIIKSLNKNEMNTYFYAPKEDKKHRLNWRNPYNLRWRQNFRRFSKFCNDNDINLIAGIAPGLDFDFKKFELLKDKSKDFILLLAKAKQLLDDGAKYISLMLDDIPDNFKIKFGSHLSEGIAHGLLANTLSKKLNQNIFFVPRIYADELIKSNPTYLKNLSSVLHKKIKVFYCGKNIISKKEIAFSKINNLLDNEIVFWDNYYSNDYCPRRLFIGPYIGREGSKNVMINPTGLIKTDLLILDIVGSSIFKKNSKNDWQKILNNHGVPVIFKTLKKFYLKPAFGPNPKIKETNFQNKYIEVIDFLLWKWKSELSREWYPFLFGLKHDLQLLQNKLTSERLIKTQTVPLSEHINKSIKEGEI
tara:strand:- start:1132 stop:2292 length:1161 start_codon:yes stop_codon:yes gene_type:complete